MYSLDSVQPPSWALCVYGRRFIVTGNDKRCLVTGISQHLSPTWLWLDFVGFIDYNVRYILRVHLNPPPPRCNIVFGCRGGDRLPVSVYPSLTVQKNIAAHVRPHLATSITFFLFFLLLSLAPVKKGNLCSVSSSAGGHSGLLSGVGCSHNWGLMTSSKVHWRCSSSFF